MSDTQVTPKSGKSTGFNNGDKFVLPMISWCRGPESNRHDPFGSQDFKSYLPVFNFLYDSANLPENTRKKRLFHVWDSLRYLGVFQPSDTQVTPKICACLCPDCVASVECPTCGFPYSQCTCPSAA